MTLRVRLVLSYCVVIAATIGLVLLLGFFLVRRQMLAGTDFLLQAEFREIEPKLRKDRPSDPSSVSAAILEHVTIDASFYFFQVHDEHGSVLFRSPNLGDKVLPDLSLAEAGCQTVTLSGLTLRLGEYPAGPLHVQIASRLDYLNELTRRILEDFALAFPAVLLLSAILSWWLGELFLRPLRSIEQTARRISISNLRERIPAGRGRDEIARLSVLLNEMFDRLEKAFEEIKQLTADLSHELRTPLSIIALHAEKLLKRRPADAEMQDALQEVLTETGRLNQIIDQILVLAKAEAQSLPLNIAPHETKAFIHEFAEDASALAEAAQRTFIVRRNEAVDVSFDASWVKQVLFNLLSNSLKFGSPGTEIMLDSYCEGTDWRLTFIDRGPGIPPELRDTVFQRFKRVAPESKTSQGSGLGLAVCKSIVELHGGKIELGAAQDGSGLSVQIRLPGARDLAG